MCFLTSPQEVNKAFHGIASIDPTQHCICILALLTTPLLCVCVCMHACVYVCVCMCLCEDVSVYVFKLVIFTWTHALVS